MTLTPAPLELTALAVRTADIDGPRLTGWLQGHLTAGVPWPALWRLVDLWLLTGGTEFHQLDEALRTWKIQHPHQGART
jgi:hypothetical protein